MIVPATPNPAPDASRPGPAYGPARHGLACTPATPVPAPRCIVGCDVGKAEVVVCNASTGDLRTLPNTPAALARFAQALDPDCLVVCEATGGFEAVLLSACLDNNRPVHRADARRVQAFIRSHGTLAKTDALDAQALARYGCDRHAHLPRWTAPSPARAELAALVNTRTDLVSSRQAWRNRRGGPHGAAVASLLTPVLDALDAQIARADARLAELVAYTPDLAGEACVVQSLKGIGATTAHALLALMPELGRVSGKQATALAGLAPYAKQSGSRTSYQATRGGRPAVKRALFMAALVAKQHNPTLRSFYERLVQAGKPKLKALTAVMRKMIVITNARLRDHLKMIDQVS